MDGFVFIPPAPSGAEMCDFCGTSPTGRLYACRNFIMPRTTSATFQHESIGAWSACDRCALLIDAGRWSDLTDRALRRLMKKHCVPEDAEFEVREQLAGIHRLFAQHRIKDV